MDIEYDLLPKQKSRKYGLVCNIDLFPLATILHEELDKKGVISRLKQVKQLGLITVTKKLEKTRYDYVMLQLYFHQIIRKNLQSELKYSYNNRLKKTDLLEDHELYDGDLTCDNPVTLADVMQILSLVYNMGHFYSTFVASRAIVLLANRDESFRKHIIGASKNDRYQELAVKVLDEKNYPRLHLLNSLLILERCDKNKMVVRVAKELLCAYLAEEKLLKNSRLHEYFSLFRKVRTASFVSYDLQIAKVPFTIDLWNTSGLLLFFREYLAEYNNKTSSTTLVNEMAGMLNASVYNELENVIIQTQISKHIMKCLPTGGKWKDYYQDYWLNKDSVLNACFPKKRDYDEQFLKLTFRKENRILAEKLFEELDQKQNTRVGYYLRHTGEMTIALSIRRACHNKTKVSFRVLKTVIGYARRMRLPEDDSIYILVSKFFLYYLFNQKELYINPVLHESKCVICTKGHNSRILELCRLLSGGGADERHEVEAMIDYLNNDNTNDTTLTISGSTIVYKSKGEANSEFDGIIIYPYRENRQVVLIEAKNTNEKVGFGRRCLNKKLKNLGLRYDYKDIVVFNHDAYCEISI